MFDFVFQLPDAFVFAALSIVAVIISVVMIFLVRRHIPLNVRYQDSAGIANTSALISIIYGVLTGLMALYLINNINYTVDAAQREANSVANLYRDSRWLNDPIRSNVQIQLKSYIDEVISVEWPALKRGEQVGVKGKVMIDEIMHQLNQYKLVNNTDLLIVRDMIEEIKNLYNAREQRVHMGVSQLSPETWAVILIGSILTLAVNFLLGMNFYLHLLTVTSVAIMTSSMVFLLVTMDRPFQGEFVVEPDALVSVQKFIEQFDPIKPPT